MAIDKPEKPSAFQAATPPEETKVEPKKEETMEVSVSMMQTLLDNQKSLEERLDNKDKEIKALNSVVSETRLKEAVAKEGVDTRSRVHFKKLRGKVVVGWPETIGEDKKNEWIFAPGNPSVPMGELLKCRYYYVDGEKSEMVDQVELFRSNELVFARVVEDRGDTALLEFEDKSVASEPIEIHKKFWNA